MKIHPRALEALKGAKITGETLAEIFTVMEAQTNVVGGISNNYTIDYQHPDYEVTADTLIPQLILVLRPAEVCE